MTLLIGTRYRALLERPLRDLAKVLWIPDNPCLDDRVAGHADLSVFIHKNNAVVSEAEEFDCLVNLLTIKGIKTDRSQKQGAVYPADAGLCVSVVGNTWIFNPKTTDPAIQRLAGNSKINTAQGYTRCSICPVSDTALITSDQDIAVKARHAGLDVLSISPGNIVLPGYPYGFIGGASIRIDPATIAFTGTLKDHPDRERMKAFLAKYGQTALYLTDRPVFDIGGAAALP